MLHRAVRCVGAGVGGGFGACGGVGGLTFRGGVRVGAVGTVWSSRWVSSRPSLGAGFGGEGGGLEEAYRALLSETRGGGGTLHEVLARPDPLFRVEGVATVVQRLRATPEPLRRQLVQRMLLSLSPREILDLGSHDAELGAMLRQAAAEHGSAGAEQAGEGAEQAGAEKTAAQRNAKGESALGGAEAGSAEEEVLRDKARFEAELADRPPRTPYASNVQYDSQYWTDAAIEEHASAHVGKVYALPGALSEVFPEGVEEGAEEEFERTGRQALLVRGVGVSLKDQLERFRAESEHRFSGQHLGWRESVEEQEERMEQEMRNSDGRFGSSLAEAGPLARWHASVPAPPAPFSPDTPAMWPARLLHGPRGIGKSCVLTYVLQYARTHGWLVLHIPDAFWAMRDGQVLTESATRPGFVDQNDIAGAVLGAMEAAHGDLLHSLPQRRAYPRFKHLPADEDAAFQQNVAERKRQEEQERRRQQARRAAGVGEDEAGVGSGVGGAEGAEEGGVEAERQRMDLDRSSYTLGDLVQWGLRNPGFATDALLDLHQELRLVTEVPVLVAVDGISELYEPSQYPFAGRMPWPTSRLSVARAFHVWRRKGARGFRGEDASGFDASMHSMKRGVVLASTSFTHRRKLRMFQNAHVPRGMIQWVPKLDRKETHALLLHYHYTGLFPVIGERAQVDSAAVDMFHTLSSGIPRELRNATQLPSVD